MSLSLKKNAFIGGVAALLFALPAYANVNKSVKIADGATSTGASSVNGSVTVGDNATVTGDLTTVNGSIRVGEGSSIEAATTVNGGLRISKNVKAEDLDTVNGAIKMAEGVEGSGSVSAVNGSISLKQGGSVAKSLSNVNGDITLIGSTVGDDVSTVNGDVSVMDGAVIKGDLRIEKSRGNSSRDSKDPIITIGPGSRVEGVIDLERKVKLYISDTAEVGGVTGVMSMDDAIRFSGNRP